MALSDCLACSGCVTSAETVLLEQQSVPEFLKLCQDTSVVLSISSPSRKAIAAALGIDGTEVIEHVQKSMNLMGVGCQIIDMSFAESISLNLTLEESEGSDELILTSHCPGWSLYAEKTQESDICNKLSKIRSADQIAGVLLKTVLPRVEGRIGRAPLQISHVTVSPCFDKKLEVLRDNYKIPCDFWGRINTPGVDLVLTTTELLQLISEKSQKLQNSLLKIFPFKFAAGILSLRLSVGPDSKSGGYAETARDSEKTWKFQRNEDLGSSEAKDGRSLHVAYGFRNIQNIVRRFHDLRRAKIVEVMACPGGCSKGGGQPRLDLEKKEDENPNQSISSFLWSLLRPSLPVTANSAATHMSPQKSESISHFILNEVRSYFGSPPHSVFSAQWRSLAAGKTSLKW